MTDDDILLAYDGSAGAKAAVGAAARLLPGRRVLVVTVWESARRGARAGRIAVPAAVIEEAAVKLDEEVRQRARALAEEGAAEARAAGLEAEAEALECHGNTWATLVDAAEARGAAAVVLGARGRSPARSALLGSVSSGVAHHSRVPVIVVPPT